MLDNDILSYINSLEIMDTHEHIPPLESVRLKNDVLSEFINCYYYVDLVSAGLSPKESYLIKNDMSIDIMDKWKMVEPYWDACSHTGYGQAVKLISRDVYGIEKISGDTVKELNDRYQKGFEEDHYQKVLKDMSHINRSIVDSISILDPDLNAFDKRFFVTANRIDNMIYPETGEDIVYLEEMTGIAVNSFDDYLDACAKRIDQLNEIGPILKLGIAYYREIKFGRATKDEAETAFNKMLCSSYKIFRWEQTYKAPKELTDYMTRFILEIAEKKNMVVQIHTGHQEGNGNILTNSDPSNLNSLFIDFPELEFDLFHIGYPYYKSFGALCKMFPNVYADMCWANVLSPVASKRALSEWLELFPYRKISGFGGDYSFVDGAYGHQAVARKNIAEVLSEKVQEGLFTFEKACDIGKAILFDNPARLFRIK